MKILSLENLFSFYGHLFYPAAVATKAGQLRLHLKPKGSVPMIVNMKLNVTMHCMAK